jgi:hypothetical protein
LKTGGLRRVIAQRVRNIDEELCERIGLGQSEEACDRYASESSRIAAANAIRFCGAHMLLPTALN